MDETLCKDRAPVRMRSVATLCITSFSQSHCKACGFWAASVDTGAAEVFDFAVTRALKVLKNFTHSVGPAVATQAGTKGNFTHSSGNPGRFASLRDVPCLLPLSAGFAWVSTCSH